MTKDNRIVGYVNDSTMADVEALTSKQDLSKSEFVSTAVEEQIERERLGTLADKNTLEMKLLRLVNDATNEAVDRLADQGAEKIATAVVKELRRLDQQSSQQNQQQQQTDDGYESGLMGDG